MFWPIIVLPSKVARFLQCYCSVRSVSGQIKKTMAAHRAAVTRLGECGRNLCAALTGLSSGCSRSQGCALGYFLSPRWGSRGYAALTEPWASGEPVQTTGLPGRGKGVTPAQLFCGLWSVVCGLLSVVRCQLLDVSCQGFTGTRRLSSSNQLRTTLIWPNPPSSLLIQNRCPSGEMS